MPVLRNERSDEPSDRLTRLCDTMVTALEADSEYQEGDQVVIFISRSTGATQMHGGTVLHGYDEDTDAMGHVFAHLEALFEANGMKLMVAPIGKG